MKFFQMSLSGPSPTHFSAFLQGGYVDVIDCLFDCAYILARHLDQQSSAANAENGAAKSPPTLSPAGTDEAARSERLRLADNASPERTQVLPTADELQTLVRRTSLVL